MVDLIPWHQGGNSVETGHSEKCWKQNLLCCSITATKHFIYGMGSLSLKQGITKKLNNVSLLIVMVFIDQSSHAFMYRIFCCCQHLSLMIAQCWILPSIIHLVMSIESLSSSVLDSLLFLFLIFFFTFFFLFFLSYYHYYYTITTITIDILIFITHYNSSHFVNIINNITLTFVITCSNTSERINIIINTIMVIPATCQNPVTSTQPSLTQLHLDQHNVSIHPFCQSETLPTTQPSPLPPPQHNPVHIITIIISTTPTARLLQDRQWFPSREVTRLWADSTAM